MTTSTSGAPRSAEWFSEGSAKPCNQVYNSGSVLFDHNRYLRNQDQVLSRLLNDLVAAAYSDDPLARLLAAVLITGAAYISAVIVWRIA
jgi:hypothetical protein